MKPLLPQTVALALLLAPAAQGATWLDRLGLGNQPASQTSGTAVIGLSQDQMVAGLKEALGKGVEHAIASLGKPDGFLGDLSVKIPLPANLKRVESSLRMLRQEQLADEFVATMNHAAEQAVPEAAAVLGESIQQMTLADAKGVLIGTNNAATQYFRRTSETNLYERFHPIVAKATEQTGVTGAYKKMLSQASFANAFLGQETGDLDAYITHKALDGLFVKIADEEQRIRENPLARTTDLLQQVFGAAQPR